MKHGTVRWKIQTFLRDKLAVGRDAQMYGAEVSGLTEEVEKWRFQTEQLITVSNQTVTFLADTRRRLAYYEENVPGIKEAREAYEAAQQNGILPIPLPLTGRELHSE